MDIISFLQGAGLATAIISVGIVLGRNLVSNRSAEKPKRRRRRVPKPVTARKPELVAKEAPATQASPGSA